MQEALTTEKEKDYKEKCDLIMIPVKNLFKAVHIADENNNITDIYKITDVYGNKYEIRSTVVPTVKFLNENKILGAYSKLFKNLLGDYVGEIKKSTIESMKATIGVIDIKSSIDFYASKNICISVMEKNSINSNYLISNITNTYSTEKIKTYFKEKQTIVLENGTVEERVALENGTVEERVAFDMDNGDSDDDSDSDNESTITTHWIYQFKFRNGNLHAIRVQEHRKFKGLTIFEISNIKNILLHQMK
jgi:hypothetical protein